MREVEKVKEREILCTVTSDPKIEGTTQVKQARESSESTDDNFISERRQETTLLFQKDKVLRPRTKM